MNGKYGEWQKTIAFLYLLVILTFLPIYMKDGLAMLGDAKYVLYRNASMILLPLWLIGELAALLLRRGRQRELLCGGFSATDFFAVCFAAVSCLSYLFSAYKETAFWGYSGWYMGLFTQLSLTAGYFLVSRWYEEERFLSACVWISAFAVCLIGVLNRTGGDPLHVYTDMAWWEWNRRNLLSTIGNINWFCSYLSVTVPFLLYCFWAGKGWRRAVWGIGAFVGGAALILQGSSSGYAALAVMLAMLFFSSLDHPAVFLRFLETVMLLSLFGFLMWLFRIGLILPHDVEYRYTPAWGRCCWYAAVYGDCCG